MRVNVIHKIYLIVQAGRHFHRHKHAHGAYGRPFMRRSAKGATGLLEHHAYLVALAGLVIFYGLERAAKESRAQHARVTSEDVPSPSVFWLHLASFLIYNLLIGYLLVNNIRSIVGLGFYVVEMGLHFVVTDFGLRGHYKHAYERTGRWLLAIAVVADWGIGVMVEIPELAMSILVALLSGRIILNVLKEELPEERHSRFSAFLVGCGLPRFGAHIR